MQTAPTPTAPVAPRPPRRALPGSIAAGARDLSVHFEGLANPTRLLIVERLAAASEMRVSELADYCQVSQPRMSWHLRILRKAEVIRTRREGREKLHFLNPVPIRLIHDRWIDKYTEHRVAALADLKHELEDTA